MGIAFVYYLIELFLFFWSSTDLLKERSISLLLLECLLSLCFVPGVVVHESAWLISFVVLTC